MSKKIMFNDKYGLTQAVLDGRNTMTRRIVSEKLLDRWTDYNDFCNSISVENTPTTRQYYDEKDFFLNNAPYKLGEVVAIAQSYMDVDRFHRKGKNAAYLEYLDSILPELKLYPGWGNKMFVKADLMPHHIEITGIKVERLQDISDGDCLKEGIIHAYTDNDGIKIYHTPHTKRGFLSTDVAQQAFAFLIDKVSGKCTWERNPFVFAYEFKLVD
ncbi:hypothetical protein [Bacteroides congonensis]